MTKEEKSLLDMFAAEWKRLEDNNPAAYQKAMALQRIRRGQAIREILDALAAHRVVA